MAGEERYGGGRIVVSDFDPEWAVMFEQEKTSSSSATLAPNASIVASRRAPPS